MATPVRMLSSLPLAARRLGQKLAFGHHGLGVPVILLAMVTLWSRRFLPLFLGFPFVVMQVTYSATSTFLPPDETAQRPTWRDVVIVTLGVASLLAVALFVLHAVGVRLGWI